MHYNSKNLEVALLEPCCANHSSKTSKYLCFHVQCQRVCEKCVLNKEGQCFNHSQYILNQDVFIKSIDTNFQQLQMNQNNAFRRHLELGKLIKDTKIEYSMQDDLILKRLVNQLEVQHRQNIMTSNKIRLLTQKISKIYHLIQYFETLKNKNLYEIKLSCSSQKGIKLFQQKNKEFVSLINKGVNEQYQSYLQQLVNEKDKLKKLNKSSLINQLKKLITFESKRRKNTKRLSQKDSQAETKENSCQKKQSSSKQRNNFSVEKQKNRKFSREK